MTQIAFQDIDAPTPVFEQTKTRYSEIESAFLTAANSDGRMAALAKWDGLRRELGTWASLVGVHFQQDTRNAEYKQALTHRDELSPKLRELELDLMRKIDASPHRDEVAAAHGGHLLDLWKCEVTTYDPAIEAETVAESKASAAYTELVASAKFEFEGETLTLSQLGKYSQHENRDLRYKATCLRWDWFTANGEKFDQIFNELVGLRKTQAAKLGFPSYIELGYQKMGRIDYEQKDVERYRRAILEEVVPLCTRIRERQRVALGLDELMAWDEGIQDPRGNPKPAGDHDWMLERAREMFDEMGGGLGPFFRLMAEGRLLDLKSREGKAGGGFCTSFPTYGVPFIFANFNGTKGDVEVFTHEVGHAFQSYSSRTQAMADYLWPTSDAAEVHSMSLEFLTWPHMEKFFGDDAERFRKLHLAEGLLFLPYGVAVDHFQHEVYANPDATPAERLAMWKRMEETYLPWRKWGDLERPAAGGFWQQQLHIYRYPFYYIDYTLAQVCAMQFLVLSQEDPERAMQAYVALCHRGGEAPFQTLVRSAGLKSPFEEGCLTGVVETARKILDL